jgi:hypothetical protein
MGNNKWSRDIKKCPVCKANLYFNRDWKQWEHKPIQKTRCKYINKK